MIGAVTDGAAAAERQLTRLRHDPSAITLTLGAPVVLVIIFGYIFGSAIAVPGGGGYRDLASAVGRLPSPRSGVNGLVGLLAATVAVQGS